MRELRCTWRALEDLGLEFALTRKSAEGLVEEHGVIRAFVIQRSQAPEGQEVTYLPVTRVPVHNLHHGRWRALTWHEAEDDLNPRRGAPPSHRRARHGPSSPSGSTSTPSVRW